MKIVDVVGNEVEAQEGELLPLVQVSTIIGIINQVDLVINVITQDLPDTIVMAREWVYAGHDPQHKEHVGKLVRRDVWVTVKRGLAAGSELGG